MIHIENYMNDGAAWQAQMVLAYIRAHEIAVINDTWNGKSYDLEIKVGRYENGREQGYVFTINIWDYLNDTGNNLQKNWAVFEHRNSDDIVVLSNELFTINTPTWADMTENGKLGKYDVDKEFPYNGACECGEYLIREMQEFVEKNYIPTK